MKNKIFFILGVALILITFSINGKTKTHDVLNIIIPSVNETVIKRTSNISNIVTDNTDRIQLCIFNKIFADRLIKYNADQQQMNDVYVNAAKKIFESRLVNKYEDLSGFIENLFHEIVGDDIHKLNEEQKQNLQSLFYGVALNLKKV